MAYAKIVHRYDDGASTTMQLGIKADGPDALDECVRRVAVLWHICVGEGEDAESEGSA